MFAVYVFLGQAKTLVDMMLHMQANQMFENGEYVVIFVDLRTYSPREAYKYIWSKCCLQAVVQNKNVKY